MAHKVTHVLDFRRRREGRTDYKKRRKMLLSGKTRFVVRKSNKRVVCQVIKSKSGQDRVVSSSNSGELKNFGWKHGTGNIPAAYLTGYLCAKRSKSREAILDSGLYISTRGSKIYAALKGAIDAGMKIPYDEKVLPSENRIKGNHIGEEVEKSWGGVISKIEKTEAKK